jgi:hypothetical protein
VLVGKPEGMGPVGRGEDNVKMDLQGIGWKDVDWINLAKDSSIVNMIMNFRVP